MADFKVSDKVRLRDYEDYSDYRQQRNNTAVITGLRSLDHELPIVIRWPDGKTSYADDNNLIKVGETTMARRTFKQLKDTPTVKKGGLWQEECEDGTQPYALINPDEALVSISSQPGSYKERSLVEENPDWFVEVFPVTPQYMTKDELDRYNFYIKTLSAGNKESKIKRPVGRPRKSVAKSPAKSSSWTPARRRAQSRKLKAYWASQR